jgi:hypothetical protein
MSKEIRDNSNHKPIYVLLYGLYLSGLNVPSSNERNDCNNIQKWILSNFTADDNIEVICRNASSQMCDKMVYYLRTACDITSFCDECDAMNVVVKMFEDFSNKRRDQDEIPNIVS